MQTGRSLLEWLRNGEQRDDPRLLRCWPRCAPAPLWPVAFALATVLAGAAPRDALLAFAWGWAENMAQAAMKAVPLGQTRGTAHAGTAGGGDPRRGGRRRRAARRRSAWPSRPMLAILSAQHETQYSRLFRS